VRGMMVMVVVVVVVVVMVGTRKNQGSMSRELVLAVLRRFSSPLVADCLRGGTTSMDRWVDMGVGVGVDMGVGVGVGVGVGGVVHVCACELLTLWCCVVRFICTHPTAWVGTHHKHGDTVSCPRVCFW